MSDIPFTEKESDPFRSLADPEISKALNTLNDDMLMNLSIPLFSDFKDRHRMKDADGFPEVSSDYLHNLNELQALCWEKAESNPQISSHIRDVMGRMTGWGFGFTSEINDINKVIEETVEDPRNDLLQNFPKYIARREIEGELFQMYTLHKNGFVEVDFIAPKNIGNGGDKGSGIIFHSQKRTFPLFYLLNQDVRNQAGGTQREQFLVPSINLCYYPELEADARTHPDFDEKKLKMAKWRRPKTAPYDQLNGYFRFIVHWNSGYMTARNVSHIRTTIEWVNYYEALKKYEIDHKKSSGSYLWVIEMQDVQAFRRWLSLTEEEKRKTGIMQAKEPGGTIVLPPGTNLTVANPKLASISDQDNDIMQMVTSGLQKPADVVLGDYKSSYASVKASQGPQGDRTNDELHYFKNFLTFDFWRPIFYLRSLADKNFNYYRNVRDVVRFDNQKPVFGRVKKPAYKLIEISLPVSRLEDIEAIAKGLLGSKHASVADTLGIPKSDIAKRLGFAKYGSLRKQKALEDEEYPETLSVDDEESAQEKQEAEPKKKDKDKDKKKEEKEEK